MRTVSVTSLIVLCLLPAPVAHGQGNTRLAAVAAVVHHVAPRVVGDPPQRTYLAYLGKTPPPELLKLVSDITHLEAMPPAWRAGAGEGSIELLDIWNVRAKERGIMLISAQTVAPFGIAVEGCTYTVRLSGNSWQVDSAATRCVVL